MPYHNPGQTFFLGEAACKGKAGRRRVTTHQSPRGGRMVYVPPARRLFCSESEVIDGRPSGRPAAPSRPSSPVAARVRW
jgi:hypothetical protein